MARILIIGCGDIGQAVAVEFFAQGHHVTGLKRHPPSSKQDIHYIKADINKAETLNLLTGDFQQAIIILSPDSSSTEAYRVVFETGINNLLIALTKKISITFISSTRVYAENNGEWVNEQTLANACDPKSRLILQAENKILAHNPLNTIIRFSGIYGRAKGYFLQQIKNANPIQQHPSYYTNRIHRSDCIGVIVHLINKKIAGDKLEPLYLATDSEPSSKWDVACYLAKQMNCNKPIASPESEQNSQNKRISNQRLIDSGYPFKYPSYQQGYQKIISDEKI